MRIDFPAAPACEQQKNFTDLLLRMPGKGRVSDLLELYGSDSVVYTFKPVQEPVVSEPEALSKAN